MLSFLRHLPLVGALARKAVSSIWIDGVGCYWLSPKDRFTIGGPGTSSVKPGDSRETADLAILSDLNRQHAAIVRTGEGYLLEARGPARVAGREVLDRVPLTDGALIELGSSARLRFRQPSVLSLSARLEFVSDHRPVQTVDAVILHADTCMLGPGDDNHIVCHDWIGQVFIVRQGDELWCRSRMPLTVNGHQLGSGRCLQSGDIVSDEEFRFRIEIPN